LEKVVEVLNVAFEDDLPIEALEDGIVLDVVKLEVELALEGPSWWSRHG
jgi:hypothetical protein